MVEPSVEAPLVIRKLVQAKVVLEKAKSPIASATDALRILCFMVC